MVPDPSVNVRAGKKDLEALQEIIIEKNGKKLKTSSRMFAWPNNK